MREETMIASPLSRRELLKGSAAACVLLAFHWPERAGAKASQGSEFAPNAFIRIEPDGGTVLVMPQVEMGQGVYTSIALILAVLGVPDDIIAADYLYKVVSGTVRTCKILVDGRRQVGGFYLSGDIFGLETGTLPQADRTRAPC